MSDYEYKIDWVPSGLMGTEHENGPRRDSMATDFANGVAAQGWELMQVVPGADAATYGGLFMAFRRPRSQT